MSETFLGFWEKLKRPIIGLAPMDGVTDFAARAIIARYGRPDVVFTEFTTVEGLLHAPERILKDFEYSEVERPVVAQIYGADPEAFYKAAHVVAELGFDGVDINMGCPSKAVIKKNCGGKLISDPSLALEIIRATRRGLHDWANGQTLEDLKLPEKFLSIEKRFPRRLLPYSVKTRIGYDKVVIEDWVQTLLQEKPAAISIHGRTLKQMYKGLSDWGAIAKAVPLARQTGTLILGNGDIGSLEEAQRAIEATGVDGVLIGRSAIGNPWIFKNQTAGKNERISVCLEHAKYFMEKRGENHFRSLGKHLAGYLRGFPEAALLRSKAMRAKNFSELCDIIQPRESAPPIHSVDPESLEGGSI